MTRGVLQVAPRYRWELGVLELYDSAESILGIEKIVNVLRGTTESAPFSSFAARQPQVGSCMYLDAVESFMTYPSCLLLACQWKVTSDCHGACHSN